MPLLLLCPHEKDFKRIFIGLDMAGHKSLVSDLCRSNLKGKVMAERHAWGQSKENEDWSRSELPTPLVG